MDIRIGITNSPREITFESSQTAAEVEAIVAAGLDESSRYIKLSDSKGRLFIVPSGSFSYIELGSESGRRVGFVA